MKDDELIANIRDAYTPPAVDADKFDAALHARIAQPAQRRGWVWGGLVATAALAAVVFLWLGGPQVAEPQPVDAPSPQIAAVLPSVPASADPTALPAENTWLAALEYDPEPSSDQFGELPDEYDELADLLEL